MAKTLSPTEDFKTRQSVHRTVDAIRALQLVVATNGTSLNLDGGAPDSNYGGISAVDGGAV